MRHRVSSEGGCELHVVENSLPTAYLLESLYLLFLISSFIVSAEDKKSLFET